MMGFFMSSTKIASLAFTISIITRVLDSVIGVWQPFFSVAAFGSLLWGGFGAFYEKKLKRFLAYTSINQIGFILIGLTCGTFGGYRSALLYLHLYILMVLGFLIIFLTTKRPDTASTFSFLTDFRGLKYSGSRTWEVYCSWFIVVLMFSMAGVPPLAGFFGKYFLLLHAQERGLWGLVVVALATSFLSAYYYLQLIKIMWFEGRRESLLTQPDFLFPCEAAIFKARRQLIFSLECFF